MKRFKVLYDTPYYNRGEIIRQIDEKTCANILGKTIPLDVVKKCFTIYQEIKTEDTKMKNIRKFKVLENLSEFNIGQIITKDSRSHDMYYSEDEEFAMDASIVENCPTVFEEIIEKPYEIIKDVSGNIFSIIRKSDGQKFSFEDNFEIKGEKGFNIIDEFCICHNKLCIVETNEDGEDKMVWYVDDILEDMVLLDADLAKNNKDELMELLKDLTDFYNKTFTKINNLIEK